MFALIGLQLPFVMCGLGDHDGSSSAWYAVVVFAAVVVVRFLWVYLVVWLPYLVSARIRARERRPGWKAPFVISWAGMRGVVSLAIAFSIPVTAEGEDFPHRYLLLFLTFTTVIGTLVVQGLTLPPLIRMLRLPGRDAQAETLAEANAQAQASRVAEERLDALLADERNALPAPLADRLRSVLECCRNAVWERLGQVNPVTGESVDDTYRRLSREMIGAEREVFVKLRDGRYIDDEMLADAAVRLDLEEAAAYRETE
ncbi:CPA1 family monovalent cation:H+ antiporter OS=Streptomyces albaduncus OX=68172 GN=FHS32_004813 PE=3 SV=1 [Streptomyces griseoloalbus]